MQYLSVCSGIEAATAAWHPLGWRPWAFSQFDPDHKGKGPDFPSAVLAHHYPDVPNLGDMTKFKDWPDATLDVLVGGTPCQSFSVAGLRGGLDDERGNLMLVYCAITRKYRPRWVVWENVPGVLSDDGGRSFAGLLGLLSGSRVEVPPGGWQSAGVVDGYRGAYGLAWRVLDSQFVRVDGFGRAVPQRRRRVFVVGYIGGDWRRAAAVLFERASMSGDSPPRRGPGQSVAGGIVASSARRGGVNEGERGGLIPEVSPPLIANGNRTGGDRPPGGDADTVLSLIPEVANPLTAQMHKVVNTTMDEGQTMIGEPFSFKASHFTRGKDGAPHAAFPPLSADADKGDQDPLICQPIAFTSKDYGADASDDVAPTLRAGGFTGSHANGGIAPAIAFNARQDPDAWEERTGPLDTDGGTQSVLAWQNRFRGDDGRGYTRAPISMEDVTGTLDTVKPWHIASQWIVRRLTPEECERLQGFSDGFTNIPWRGKNGAPDGPRYKALGNSMSVNVMRWIGVRINMVDEICNNNLDIGVGGSRIAT